MSKVTPFILLILALNFSMFIWQAPTGSSCQANINDNNPIWQLACNPNNQWGDTIVTLLFGSTFAALAATAALIGIIFFRSDLIALAPVATALLSWGFTISNFYGVVTSDTALWGNNPAVASLVAMIIMVPITIGYVWMVMDWWGNRN